MGRGTTENPGFSKLVPGALEFQPVLMAPFVGKVKVVLAGGPVMGNGRPWKGRIWVVTTGCATFGGASLSLPGQARGVPGVMTVTACEGWDH